MKETFFVKKNLKNPYIPYLYDYNLLRISQTSCQTSNVGELIVINNIIYQIENIVNIDNKKFVILKNSDIIEQKDIELLNKLF